MQKGEKYIGLRDAAGKPLDANTLALQWVQTNNYSSTDDNALRTLIATASKGRDWNGTMEYLSDKYQTASISGQDQVLDAVAFFTVRKHIQEGLSNNQPRIDAPNFLSMRSGDGNGINEGRDRVDQRRETDRINQLSPLDVALEQVVEQPAYRDRVRTALKPFMGNTDYESRHTALLNAQYGYGRIGKSYDLAQALKVFELAHELQSNPQRLTQARQTAANKFDQDLHPSQEGGEVHFIPQAAAATLKPGTGKAQLQIGGKDAYGAAWEEFMGASGSQVPEAIRRKADKLVRGELAAITDAGDDKFKAAFAKFDAASAGDSEDAKANAWARSLLYRARHIKHEQDGKKTSTDRLSTGDEMGAYYFGANSPLNTKRTQIAEAPPQEKPATQTQGGGAHRAAPTGDEKVTGYGGKHWPAENTDRNTVREVQLYLEAIYMTDAENVTGAGNSRRYREEGLKEASAMDGIVGERTDKTIRRFQKENGLPENGKLDEATLAKLREAGQAKIAAIDAEAERDANQTSTGASADQGTTQVDPKDAAVRTTIQSQLTEASKVADTALAFNDPAAAQKQIDALVSTLSGAGVKATDFKVEGDKTLSSVVFTKIEQILGLSSDGKDDGRIDQLLGNTEVVAAIVPRLKESLESSGRS